MAIGDKNIRYLNLDRIEAQENSASKFMKWGYGLIIFFSFGILGCLLNKLRIRDNPIPPENLPVYVLLLIPSAIPILISKKKTEEIKAARRY